MKNILIVPGFMVDTYGRIEESYVKFSEKMRKRFNIHWLVPPSREADSARYYKANNLNEVPIYVQRLKNQDCTIIDLDIQKYHPVHNFLQFRRIIKNHNINLVWVHFGYEKFYVAFFCKILGVHLIWNEHGPSLGPTRRFKWFKRIFYKLIINHFNSVSRAVGDTVAPYGKVTVVPNAINPDEFEPVSEERKLELRSRYGIQNDEKVIGMIAQFKVYKRHKWALDVFNKVLEVYPYVKLLLVGEGSSKSAVQEYVKKLDIKDKVGFTGYVKNINEILSISSITILTSNNEGFPYVIPESMLKEVPVVATNTGGVPEIIDHGINGFVTNVDDKSAFAKKVIRLLKDDNLRKEMGKKAQEKVLHNFTFDKWCERLAEIIENA